MGTSLSAPLVAEDGALADRFVDLVEEVVDVALRTAGELGDSSLIARRLAWLYALYPGTRHLSAKVRAFGDFVAPRFAALAAKWEKWTA